MSGSITISEEAARDLLARYTWIAERAGEEGADGYDRRLRDRLRRLSDFPRRGTPRNEIAPGLRSLSFERTLLILYRADEWGHVEIVRILGASQDMTLLRVE